MHPPLSRPMLRVLPSVSFFHSRWMAQRTPWLSHQRGTLKRNGGTQQVNLKPWHLFSLAKTGIISCLLGNFFYERIMLLYEHYSIQMAPDIKKTVRLFGSTPSAEQLCRKSSTSLEVLIMSQTCSVVWWSLSQVLKTCLILSSAAFWKWTSQPLSLPTGSLHKNLVLQQVAECIRNGWPRKIPKEFTPYFQLRSELAIFNQCYIARETCAVIPES